MNCPVHLKCKVLKQKIDVLQQELFNLEEECKQQNQTIKVGDVIVLKSGRKLQLCSVYHQKGKTLILVNLVTGTIYRQIRDMQNTYSKSMNDFVVDTHALVWPLNGILNAFRIGEDEFHHIKDAHKV